MSSTYEQEVLRCEKWLKGLDGAQRYKNSRIYILPGQEKTEEERGDNNICPETNLNPDYHIPVREMRRQYQNGRRNHVRGRGRGGGGAHYGGLDPYFLQQINS